MASSCCPPPPPPTSSAAAITVLDLNTAPKMEPKVEPLGEDDRVELKRSNACPGQAPGGIRGFGTEEPTPLRGVSSNPDEDYLFAEYYRLAHLFLSTFANKDTCLKPTAASPALAPATPVVTPADWAIVPAPPDDGAHNAVVVARRRKKLSPRSAEMVRVSSIGDLEYRYFRSLVRKTRATYESLRVILSREEEKGTALSALLAGRRSRADLKAAALMMDRNLWINRDKRIIASVPGVHVGDIFFFRMELCVIGIHGQVQGGIDYVPATRTSSREPIATSIVISGGYEDDEDTGNVIVYTGHGGRSHNMVKHSVDQKLEGGNLALERSMKYGIEIRVIRGFKFEGSPSARIYVYDGLYRVVHYWQDVGKSGFTVYKYKLVRIAGQDEMGSSVLRRAEELKEKLSKTRPVDYLSHDISMGKENLPVPLFNDIDGDRDPMLFEYLVRPVFPPSVVLQRPQGNGDGGCQCVTSCSENCYCAMKNGGDFAYDANGILVMGKPLIYECGSSCRCPPTCRNRVSQKGVRNRLEVFRSKETGWGVRSLDLIPAGSFICEFTGIVLTEQQTEVVAMNGDSLVYPNRFPNRWFEWGDISHVIPEYARPMVPSLPPLRFSVDVSRVRNVACYLSHSCSPNVFLQFVLYDHYDVLYPHLMIFAMENIPPLKELSIDYGVGDGSVAKLSL